MSCGNISVSGCQCFWLCCFGSMCVAWIRVRLLIMTHPLWILFVEEFHSYCNHTKLFFPFISLNVLLVMWGVISLYNKIFVSLWLQLWIFLVKILFSHYGNNKPYYYKMIITGLFICCLSLLLGMKHNKCHFSVWHSSLILNRLSFRVYHQKISFRGTIH